MKKITKTQMLLMAIVLLTFASPAFANAGQVARTVFGQMTAFADVITAGVFLAGLGVGAAAALKFKAHSENAQQVPLKVPMVYAIVAALLIGFPAYLKMSKTSLFGAGPSNGMGSSVYNRIGG